MFAAENSVPQSETAKQLRLQLAGCGKAPKTKLDSCAKRRRKKFSGRARNSVVKLQNPMWWPLTQQFGLRGRQEHHGMRLEDFRTMKGDDGFEFVEFSERPAKTRLGALNAKPQFSPKYSRLAERDVQLRYFAGTSAVGLPYLRTSGPFYLLIKYNRGSSDEIWYKVQPMGENKINSMMESIIPETTLESSEKWFSNYSARKTLVSKMKKANLERSSIASHWSQKYLVFR